MGLMGASTTHFISIVGKSGKVSVQGKAYQAMVFLPLNKLAFCSHLFRAVLAWHIVFTFLLFQPFCKDNASFLIAVSLT